MGLSVGDLAQKGHFGLDFVASSRAASAAEISGAEVLQLGSLPSTQHRHLVVLTSTAAAELGVVSDEALVQASRDVGVAAIVYRLGPDARAPVHLLECASRVELPVFLAPSNVSLRAVKESIDELLAQADIALYQELLAFQTALIEAASGPDPTTSLLRELGRALGATVILYLPDGRLLASAGEGPTSAIWEKIDKSQHESQTFTVGQWRVDAALIGRRDSVHRWLALAGKGRHTTEAIVSPLIRTVEQLLDVIAVARRAAANEDALLRAEMLERLLSNEHHETFGWDRLRPFGFKPHGLCWVAVLAPADRTERRGAAEQQLGRLTQALSKIMSDFPCPYLLGRYGAAAIVLVQGPDSGAVEEWIRVLDEQDILSCAGIGRRVVSLDLVVDSYRDAQLALSHALVREPASPQVQRFSDFSLADVAISTADEEQLARRSRDLLVTVQAHEPLLEALLAYLEHDLSVNDVAAALHVHPNTVRYRLARIEELIGASLRSLPTIVDIYLGLQMLARGSGGSANASYLRGRPPAAGTGTG